MILENIADVIAGQIMTRVTEDNNDGEPVQVLAPKAISNGIIIKEDLGKAVLSKDVDENKYTKEGDVVIKLSTPYDAAYVTSKDIGLVIPSFCATIRISNDNLIDAKYLSAFLNTSYVRNQLTAKVVGSSRPMIKISDIRALEIPEVSIEDMRDIGEAYILSGRKKEILLEMVQTESMLMENIILASIKEGMNNE
ncbi:hypothetical protein [Bariatricus sp. HCP28S3_C2]|uniref:hypothetical protein n=1 Tax=unclassified Bariatricus TaxID=2677046 RepID=UPI003F8C037F